jgi:hypothetical protein
LATHVLINEECKSRLNSRYVFHPSFNLINKTEGILVLFLWASNGRTKNVGRSISEQSINVFGPTATVGCRK